MTSRGYFGIQTVRIRLRPICEIALAHSPIHGGRSSKPQSAAPFGSVVVNLQSTIIAVVHQGIPARRTPAAVTASFFSGGPFDPERRRAIPRVMTSLFPPVSLSQTRAPEPVSGAHVALSQAVRSAAPTSRSSTWLAPLPRAVIVPRSMSTASRAQVFSCGFQRRVMQYFVRMRGVNFEELFL
jgi:hypothetical protein